MQTGWPWGGCWVAACSGLPCAAHACSRSHQQAGQLQVVSGRQPAARKPDVIPPTTGGRFAGVVGGQPGDFHGCLPPAADSFGTTFVAPAPGTPGNTTGQLPRRCHVGGCAGTAMPPFAPLPGRWRRKRRWRCRRRWRMHQRTQRRWQWRSGVVWVGGARRGGSGERAKGKQAKGAGPGSAHACWSKPAERRAFLPSCRVRGRWQWLAPAWGSTCCQPRPPPWRLPWQWPLPRRWLHEQGRGGGAFSA